MRTKNPMVFIRRMFMFPVMLVMAALFAQGSAYGDYYKNLPTEVKPVREIVFPDRTVILTDFGAKGDAVTLNTRAFADAIAALEAQGGGILQVPAGVWLTGPIELKSNICLNLDKNAIVQFSPDKTLYAGEVWLSGRALPCIRAVECTNVGITGEGIIDGSGAAWRYVKRAKVSDVEWNRFRETGGVLRENDTQWFPWQNVYGYKDIAATPEKGERMRNDLFWASGCDGILLRGVTFQNSPRFHVHPYHSVNVIIDGITVRAPWNAQNADSIDLTDCHCVLIVNTTVDGGDDGYCLKSSEAREGTKVRGCEDILIRNSTAFHCHGGFVIGSNDVCGMRRIVCKDCRMSGSDTGLRFKSAIGRGGKTEDVWVSDIVMSDIQHEAIIFECTYADVRNEPDTKKAKYIPEFQDIHISDVICRGCDTGIKATGLPGLRCVYDINISNSTFVWRKVPAKIDAATADLTLRNVTFLPEGPAN